ncbi:hypothetical protein ASPZODRAFT_67243 [Penicilliopsis zonata CBS 506.65]|uniref:Uncharacterized protein n=1 Tax=Penicilliopsis zonata CBS 506.65 TaxID=1073090 RepID=A0A1L9SFZ3_9EURO|nr:hypothetical protein ASPZODRAFT_67243 [Penicilliopsis zonata CBS 506.65]OJJ46160.1 hypothetical protein ASPZODRAFT_67243 [Penicilliopsis zonata CBS 506.65]
MSYSYPSARGTRSFNPVAVLERVRDSLPAKAREWIVGLRARSGHDLHTSAWRAARRLICVTNGLILLWILTLWWGERTVFRDGVEACQWGNWEKWPQGATPHHVAFVADPQLVDPHTYPGRPWPLSTLTVKYTDQYMRRSFSSVQRKLAPDSVLFLGDLFDGGREWARGEYSSPEKQYQGYKDSFWKNEFGRFVRVFSEHLNDGDPRSMDPRGRRMIASLPGNHDLGFGTGVQQPVRDRFQAYFGTGNRVDVIGNHTFVSVDTVSLSAMDQPDPNTGSSGTGSGDGQQPNYQIWKDSESFLNSVHLHKAAAESQELRMLNHHSEGIMFHHRVFQNALEPSVYKLPEPRGVDLPTVLLTHVPLFRQPATPCGPLREKYPPSSEGELEQDEPNALKIQGGYQYQNVLTPAISNDIVSKVGPTLIQVYSGDDHDYCEITHREFSGSPKEITVKSLSWAMGVRRPGLVLASLWNPIDPQTGKAMATESAPVTLQNHLCLLPDQLGIFIQYGCLFAFTLLVLLVRAVVLVFHPPPVDRDAILDPVLPLTEQRSQYPPLPPRISSPPTSSTSSSKTSSPVGLASRAVNAPTPRYNPSKPYSDAYPIENYSDGSKWKGRRPGGPGSDSSSHQILREFIRSIKTVARIVFLWYFYLIWTW